MQAARQPPRTAARLLAMLLVLGSASSQAGAQEPWSPSKPWPEQRSENTSASSTRSDRSLPPAGAATGAYAQPEQRFEHRNRTVQQSDLEPVRAPDDSGLPLDLWRGVDLKALEDMLAVLDLPPRSTALHHLWRRMLMSSASPPAGVSDDHFLALRLEALYRSGLLQDMKRLLEGTARGPLIQALRARLDLSLGARDAGCQAIAALAAASSGLPGRLKGEAQLLAGYCGALAGDGAAAGLAASLAREERVDAELPLAVLEGVASGTKPTLHLPKRILLVDYRFLELLGPVNVMQVLDRAEPALLAAVAGDAGSEACVRVAAAERAIAVHALAPEVLAEAYRGCRSGARSTDLPTGSRGDALLQRAHTFQAIEQTAAPSARGRLIRTLLEEARRADLYTAVAYALAPTLTDLQPSPQSSWFAETAIEATLAAGNFAQAREWAQASQDLQHWLALIEIAAPETRGTNTWLTAIEDLALRGRVHPDALHRLVTVLNALDIQVPIPLWDVASRTPQPSTGYLPETGVLADLNQAAQRRETGRTILLAMRTLGSGAAEGANILALRDAIRALKHAGLEADARRLGFEALYPAWPRATAVDPQVRSHARQ